MLQKKGTNPSWQLLLNTKLNFIWNLGNKNTCWSSANTNIGLPTQGLTGALACRKSGASYGVKKINGIVRGDIKRPLRGRI